MKTSLDKRRKRQNGTYPIVFRITYQGESRDINTKFTCKLSDWNTRLGSLKQTSNDYEVLNKRLQEQRIKYQEKLLEFERSLIKETTNVQMIKDYLIGHYSRNTSVLDFWKEEIKRLELAKHYGTARSYKHVQGAVNCHKSLDIPFGNLDYSWLLDLETVLKSNGLKQTSVSVYFRTIRALYNKAINHGIVDFKDYPFRRYKIKSGKSSPRVASIEELQRFFALNLPASDPVYDHWNYGRLIFLLRGINFADLALLTQENLKKGRLIYSRRKTHKSYSVELLPLAKQLFETYRDDTRRTLLPIIKEEELMVAHNLPDRISQQRKTTNKWLSRIGAELGIEERLSTYVFRYSHANACKKLGYSKDLISESLGHGYGLAVSSAYLENYDIELVDEMNEVVCNQIIGGR